MASKVDVTTGNRPNRRCKIQKNSLGSQRDGRKVWQPIAEFATKERDLRVSKHSATELPVWKSEGCWCAASSISQVSGLGALIPLFEELRFVRGGTPKLSSVSWPKAVLIVVISSVQIHNSTCLQRSMMQSLLTRGGSLPLEVTCCMAKDACLFFCL